MWTHPSGRPVWQTPKILVPVGVFSALVLLFLALPPAHVQIHQPHLGKPLVKPAIVENKWDSSNFLTGNLTGSFRTSLKPDQKYITGFLGGGMTNDFMTMVNMIYLGFQTQRISIVPPFFPNHIGRDNNPPLLFSEVFDIPRFSKATQIPLVEWSQVKKFPFTIKGIGESDDVENIGCWSPWAQITGKPRFHEMSSLLKIDVSFTATGHQTVLSTALDHASLPLLAPLAFPWQRSNALKEHSPLPSSKRGVTLPPDEHLLCFDYLYFAGTAYGFEWWRDFSPVWRMIGTNFRWTEKVETLAYEYLTGKFGVSKKEDIPPFISIHVRRSDFHWQCNGTPTSQCFAPLSTYANHVDSVRRILLEKKGIDVKEVVLTSDESDPKFWDEVTERRWKWFHHQAEGTATKYGKWYEPVLDSVFLSMGAGLVGSAASTMSLVAGRRVEDWNGGVWQIVKWGPYKDKADDF